MSSELSGKQLSQETKDYFGKWLRVIPNALLLKYQNMLMQATLNGISFEPNGGKVFKAFKECHLDDCKAVLLFQDPYPQHGIATGIACANDKESKDFKKVSPSLQVLKNSVLSFEGKKEDANFDLSLLSWEKQGILMLNSALTVQTDRPGSHSDAWKPFIAHTLWNLGLYKPNLFFGLFGRQAWDFERFLPKEAKVVYEYHPAYYARNNASMPVKMWQELTDYCRETFNQELSLS